MGQQSVKKQKKGGGRKRRRDLLGMSEERRTSNRCNNRQHLYRNATIQRGKSRFPEDGYTSTLNPSLLWCYSTCTSSSRPRAEVSSSTISELGGGEEVVFEDLEEGLDDGLEGDLEMRARLDAGGVLAAGLSSSSSTLAFASSSASGYTLPEMP